MSKFLEFFQVFQVLSLLTKIVNFGNPLNFLKFSLQKYQSKLFWPDFFESGSNIIVTQVKIFWATKIITS